MYLLSFLSTCTDLIIGRAAEKKNGYGDFLCPGRIGTRDREYGNCYRVATDRVEVIF